MSSVNTAFVVQMLVAEIVRRLEQAGTEALVCHERNAEIESRYVTRLRRWAM